MIDAEQLAQAFLAARAARLHLTEFPGPLPPTLEIAYAVQDRLIAGWATPVAGWKIAGIRPEFRGAAGAGFLCGPIFKETISQAYPGKPSSLAVLQGGFNAIEAELVFKLGRKVEPAERIEPAGVAALISELRLGVEVAGNPLAGISALGPSAVAAGFGNNLGLILGPAVASNHLSGQGRLLETRVNDEVVGNTRLVGIEDRIPGFLALLAMLGERDIALEAGSWVSTGALTGVHDIGAGDSFQVELEGLPAICGAALI